MSMSKSEAAAFESLKRRVEVLERMAQPIVVGQSGPIYDLTPGKITLVPKQKRKYTRKETNGAQAQ
jgi:hypothetical protein